MKKVKDKQVLVGADFAGFPLKEVVAEHLRKKGWTVTDIGVKSADEKEPEMFHRIGLKVGAKISEGEFERALIFCGTGMGIRGRKCTGGASRNYGEWSKCACNGSFLCRTADGKGYSGRIFKSQSGRRI